MDNTEFTATEGEYRVRVVRDDYPPEPEFDAATPLLRVDACRVEPSGYGRESMKNDGLPTAADWILTECMERMGGLDEGVALFDRHLRAFHGGRAEILIRPGHRTDYAYVGYTTLTMATDVWGYRPEGVTEEILMPNAGEYEVWLEGDVYGIIVEKRDQYIAKTFNMDGSERSSALRTSWDEVEAVWGYYDSCVYTQDPKRSHTVAEALDTLAAWANGAA